MSKKVTTSRFKQTYIEQFLWKFVESRSLKFDTVIGGCKKSVR